jgi:hypothetical protein
MMGTSVMFALMIRKILLAWMPVKCVHLMHTLVTNPEEPLFHQTGPLLFDRAICDAHHGGIDAMHWSLRLNMPHVLKDASNNNTCLASVE